MEQTGAGAIQPRAFAGDGHILAGTAKSDDIDKRQFRAVQAGDVAVMLHARQALGGDANGEGLNFRCPHGLNTRQQAAQRKAPGAIEQTAEG